MKIKEGIIITMFIMFGYLAGALTVYLCSVNPLNSTLKQCIEIPKYSNNFDKLKAKKGADIVVRAINNQTDTIKKYKKRFKLFRK